MSLPSASSIRNWAAGLTAVMLIALPFTAKEEGLRVTAYLDSVNVPTICYGETYNVELGDVRTNSQCNSIFMSRLGSFALAVDLMVEPDLPPETHAALTSWAYNVGLEAARKSTLLRLLNSGDLAGACDQLLKWKYAGNKPILLPRRERERALCRKGLGL